MKNVSGRLVIVIVLLCVVQPFCSDTAWAVDPDPERTVTIHIHGFTPLSQAFDQPFGVDIVDINDAQYGKAGFDTVALAAILGRPTILDPGGDVAPNLVTAVSFFGNQIPSYYDAQDVAEYQATASQWNGGVPTYALIIAKFVRHVLERTGADHVNLVGVSLGGLVTRYMIEHDLEGLASEGRITRWITFEGVVAGNWAASQGIASVLTFLGVLEEEVNHMKYSWVDANLNQPGNQLDNPAFESIFVAHGISTRDDLVLGALTNATYLLNGSFLANDGINLVRDGYFHDVTLQSRYLGAMPPISYHDSNHFTVLENQGALAQLASTLTGSRRVKVTLDRARVATLKEGGLFQSPPAEVVFNTRATSSWIASQWNITDPVSALDRVSGVPPRFDFQATNTWQDTDFVIFDDFVPDGETLLHFDLDADELDWEDKYGVFEVLFGGVSSYATGSVDVSVDSDGSYPVIASDWEGVLEVEVTRYPVGVSLFIPDLEDPLSAGMSITGESVPLRLDTGPGQAGRIYLIVGSATGTQPGTPLPGGDVLPVNWDVYSNLVMSTLNTPLHDQFSGTLGAGGRADATLNATAITLSPTLVGLKLDYAAVVLMPPGGPVTLTTNSVEVVITP